jgi:hypothetical protein
MYDDYSVPDDDSFGNDGSGGSGDAGDSGDNPPATNRKRKASKSFRRYMMI